MGFSSVIRNFFYGISDNRIDKREFIFYKIVNSSVMNNTEFFEIQCINKKALFFSKLEEIIFDTDILYHFHPSQACYIGILYGKNHRDLKYAKDFSEKTRNGFLNRYGTCEIRYQTRDGLICFLNKDNKEEFVMDARDIALSDELISEFDASQAFSIGVVAGMKLQTLKYPSNRQENVNCSHKPTLRIVK